MNIYPSETEFEKLAQKGNLVPVCADLMADFETPVSVFAKLRSRKPAFLFESVTGGEQVNRFSFAGADARKIFKVFDDRTLITDADGTVTEIDTPAEPLSLVEQEMARYKPVDVPGVRWAFWATNPFTASSHLFPRQKKTNSAPPCYITQ